MRKESDVSNFICRICREDKNYVAIGICNHKKVCLYCAMKSRMFYNDPKCPICNTILMTLFVIPIQERNTSTFEDLDKQKEYYYKDDDYTITGIYFNDLCGKEEAIKLKGFNCPIELCISEPFETMNELKQHLNLLHKKIYCDVCIKDGKQFLSEQLVYSQEAIGQHYEFGRYTEQQQIIIPPHPQCPFCKVDFYNDELLFKHINEQHFLCDICRKDKKIICYSALPNLIDHYKIKHYCCPYKSCVNDLYVVFGKEQELSLHLVSKHNIINYSDKLSQLIRENKPREITNPENWSIALSKDEFNYTQFIEKLNQKAIQHSQMISKLKEYEDQKEMSEYGNWAIKHNDDKYKVQRYQPWKIKENNQFNHTNEIKTLKDKDKDKVINKDNKTQFQPEMDYSFILQFYIKLLKSFVIEKIAKDKLLESEFILEKEIICQLIMIIDKIEINEKILQLPFLHNFGLELEITNRISKLLLQGDNIIEEEFISILETMAIKKTLIVYKYLYIAQKKVDQAFYKLEIEQIEEDLYDDFIKRPYIQKPNEEEYQYGNNQNKKKNKKKKHNQWNWDQKSVPGLYEVDKEKSSLHYLFGNNTNTQKTVSKPPLKSTEPFSAMELAPKHIEQPAPVAPKKKSNLAMLLDSTSSNNNQGNQTKNKKQNRPGGQFKISNYNLDEDFPSLK